MRSLSSLFLQSKVKKSKGIEKKESKNYIIILKGAKTE